ncbi:hypothetical protein GA0115240_171116 [Streptomyces sp. DvalAA-14]|uniref:hypothetical protein n=1 Tax=unclassified Streptomyces TaxID=2593676 RepID=UPI00081B8A80|nr:MULTISPECIES: hypothetical protein [unclassified Streptomyces]MYS24910.1 hypothetical protein [Streptomyces sp. SID4948]SCE50482.1 hypothetical protein GA0115240_171116 [Streptomyces sp. DvalAA-14]
MDTTPTDKPDRILVVGRSPSVLVATVDILRAKGYTADATNQFDHVLDDYDLTDLDVLVFGGMVPADTKQYLREEVSKRNPQTSFVQGLAGIAGLIAAQVEAFTSHKRRGQDSTEITYDAVRRCVQLTLEEPAHVTVEALWATSFTPPEPKSTSLRIFDGTLQAGFHVTPLPERVPSEASYITVAVNDLVRVFTVGTMPDAVTRMVPTSTSDKRLPDVGRITTSSDDH